MKLRILSALLIVLSTPIIHAQMRYNWANMDTVFLNILNASSLEGKPKPVYLDYLRTPKAELKSNPSFDYKGFERVVSKKEADLSIKTLVYADSVVLEGVDLYDNELIISYCFKKSETGFLINRIHCYYRGENIGFGKNLNLPKNTRFSMIDINGYYLNCIFNSGKINRLYYSKISNHIDKKFVICDFTESQLKYGVMDYKTGEELIPAIYTMVEINTGVITNYNGDNYSYTNYNCFIVNDANKYGIYNMEGALQHQMIDKKIEKVFDAESILVYEAGKRAVINSKGELIVPWNQIDDIDKCEFGFYKLEDTGYGGGTTAFYTPLGKKIDSYGFFYMANLINDLKSQGIFRFTTGVDNVLKYGFVLKSGEVIEPYFNYANEDFSCGLCKIENDKGLYGYINTKGIVMTPCIYKSVESTCGSDLFQVVNENDLTGFVNTQGKLVIPCLYKEASSFYQGRSRFYKDGSYYSIYPDGRVVKD